MKYASHRDYAVSAFRALAIDGGDSDMIACARRLTNALRTGWKAALPADVATMRDALAS